MAGVCSTTLKVCAENDVTHDACDVITTPQQSKSGTLRSRPRPGEPGMRVTRACSLGAIGWVHGGRVRVWGGEVRAPMVCA